MPLALLEDTLTAVRTHVFGSQVPRRRSPEIAAFVAEPVTVPSGQSISPLSRDVPVTSDPVWKSSFSQSPVTGPIAGLKPVHVPAHTPEMFGGAGDGDRGRAPPSSPPQETSVRLKRMFTTAMRKVG